MVSQQFVFLIPMFVVVLPRSVSAAPTDGPVDVREASNVTQELNWDSDRLSDQDLENYLQRLRDEINSSIGKNPQNYVSDDVSVEDLVKLIQNEQLMNNHPPHQANDQVALEDYESPESSNRLSSTITTTTATTTTFSTDEEPLDCPICLDPLRDKPEGILECLHRFHKICIEKWLSSTGYYSPRTGYYTNSYCPICRRLFHHVLDIND